MNIVYFKKIIRLSVIDRMKETKFSISKIKYLLVLYTISVLIVSCDIDTYNTASPQNSSTLDESKERGVLVKELKPIKNFFIINKDTIEIQKIWIENIWFYSPDGKDKKVKTNGANQLIIQLKRERDMDKFMVGWGVDLGNNDYGSGSGNINIYLGRDSIKHIYSVYVNKYKIDYEFLNADKIDSLVLVD